MNFYAFFCVPLSLLLPSPSLLPSSAAAWRMFLVICRRCQLSVASSSSSSTRTAAIGLHTTRLHLLRSRTQRARSHARSLSLFACVCAIASRFVLCKLLATLFECLVVSGASQSQKHLKTFQFAALSHALSCSLSLSLCRFVCRRLQSLLSFGKNGCLCARTGVVSCFVCLCHRNTVELERQIA